MRDDNQPFLPGFGPEPRLSAMPIAVSHKFFYALSPGKEAAAMAFSTGRHLKRQNGLAGKSVKQENLHVTLFPFWAGNEPPADLAEIASAHAQTIMKQPFRVSFDMAMSFRRKNGFCLVLGDTGGASGIYDLQRQLVIRFQSVIRAGSLTPHMTLLYTDTFVEKQPVEPVRWTAREFVLIHSFVRSGRHEIEAHWPLR